MSTSPNSLLIVLGLVSALCAQACNGGGGSGGHATPGSGTGTGTGTNTGANSPNSGAPTIPSGGSGGGNSAALGQVFPADNPWNTDISAYPVHPNSANFIASIGLSTALHADFGTVYNGAPNGIPYVTVGGTQPRVPITFTAYGSESDPGPYPVPSNAPIEGGPNGTGDRHVLVIDTDNRMLYEMFRAFPNASGGWDCESGAVFDLRSNALRPAGWTSADAAGLPVFPGLVRYDEAVTQGEIRHALRFTVSTSQRARIEPARHWASSNTDPNRPPMGLRVRLKANVDISGYPAEVQVILTCLKRYGMIVADNGSNWFISGAPDARWNDSNLSTISGIKGSDFEAVYTGPTITP
jgi:hypothetical protein